MRPIALAGALVVLVGFAGEVDAKTRERPLTKRERRAAQGVFGEAIDLDQVRIVAGATDGYAVTLGNTIYSPKTLALDLLIHELTHVWQAQREGASYAFKALYAQATDGYDYGGEERLLEVRADGGTIDSFNAEQQGEILADYYLWNRWGWDTSAYEPYVEDVRGE